MVRKYLDHITVKQVSAVWVCLITHWKKNPKATETDEQDEDVFILNHHELPEARSANVCFMTAGKRRHSAILIFTN